MSQGQRIARLLLLPLAVSAVGAPLLFASGPDPGVLCVDDDAPPNGDGLSWRSAFSDLQQALTAAGNSRGTITQVHVAQGVYKPSLRTDQADPRSATFQLASGLEVLGGYAGLNAKDPEARDVDLYPTILSGDLDGNDGPAGSFLNYDENSYHVVTAGGVDSTARLDGLTITAGSACCGFVQTDPRMWGGGLFCMNGSPSINGCKLGISRSLRGGGAYFENGAPSLVECVLTGNVATQRGGGIYGNATNLTLESCSFTDNSAPQAGGVFQGDGQLVASECVFGANEATDYGGGGGVLAINSTIDLFDCSFSNNSATESSGGAIACITGRHCSVTGCAFTGNYAGDGGAIRCGVDNLVVSDSSFVNNHTIDYGDGGAIYFDDGTATIDDCVFAGNYSQDHGGAISVSNGTDSAFITHSSFQNNHAGISGGGAVGMSGQGVTIDGCAFQGNSAWEGGALVIYTNFSDVRNCSFTANLANGPFGAGGAVSIENQSFASTLFGNCLFASNTAVAKGGAVAYSSGSSNGSPSYVNCLFTGNQALDSTSGRGGAIYNQYSDPKIINCTFSGNSAGGTGGAMHSQASGSPSVTNCIAWGNTPDQFHDAGAVTSVSYSNIEGGWSGAGSNNIALNPMFANPGAADFSIAPGSPCIDAADNSVVPAGTLTDLAGHARYRDDPKTSDTGNGAPPLIDMGCYEFEPTCAPDCAMPQDGFVNALDVAAIIASWGDTSGPADINGDGSVNVGDLLQVINNWGSCP